MSKDRSARDEIFAQVREAVKTFSGTPLQPPASARFEPRRPAGPEEEMEKMLAEVKRLSGYARRVRGRDEFAAALGELVNDRRGPDGGVQ